MNLDHDHDHDHDHDTGTGLVCPECDEPACADPPTGYLNLWGIRPTASHTDGSPLCPVIGPYGYQPAEPVPTAVAPIGPADTDAGAPPDRTDQT